MRELSPPRCAHSDRIGLKATTTEGSGPEGRGECIRANAVALLYAL
jgi:2C-methyl-D-erythritol 2,4-cyclodiphosphate synthase